MPGEASVGVIFRLKLFSLRIPDKNGKFLVISYGTRLQMVTAGKVVEVSKAVLIEMVTSYCK